MMSQHRYRQYTIKQSSDLKYIQVMIIQHRLLSIVVAHRFHLSIERGTKLCDRYL